MQEDHKLKRLSCRAKNNMEASSPPKWPCFIIDKKKRNSKYYFLTNSMKIYDSRIAFCRSSHPRCSVRKGILRNFAKHLWQSLVFNKVTPATLLKKRLWHRCFSENIAKFLRTTFLTEHLWATYLVSDVLF